MKQGDRISGRNLGEDLQLGGCCGFACVVCVAERTDRQVNRVVNAFRQEEHHPFVPDRAATNWAICLPWLGGMKGEEVFKFRE